MTTKKTNPAASAEGATQVQKTIPSPPGGGRWKWDEASEKWIDMSPQPEPQKQEAPAQE